MPPQAPRALPATQGPIALDTLLARALPARPAPPSPRPAPRTLTELEAASASPRPLADTPVALVLSITVATCSSCGAVHRCPPTYLLARYSPNEHTLHHSRADMTRLPPDLPRERREIAVTIPACEACF